MSGKTCGQVRLVADLATVSLFALVLWLPTVDTFFGIDGAPVPDERRLLAERPALALDAAKLGEFPGRYEAYFNDHFGYRKRLIRWYNRAQNKLFDATPTSLAIRGKSGWLFYAGDWVIQYHRALEPFTDADLAAWRAALEGLRDRLARRGVRFLFVVAPNKHTIYPEFLPDWANARANPASRLDQLLRHMAAGSDVAVLDLRPALLEAKIQRPVYYRSDTHWNALGAHVAYARIMTRLGEWFPGLRAVPLPDLRRETGSRLGDLATMAGLEDSAEDVPALAPASGWRAVRVDETPAVSRSRWARGMEPVVMENADAPAVGGRQLRAVVLRDSFCISLIPFLSEHFGRSVYVWQYGLDDALIEAERPDVVILQMVERSLMTASPGSLLPTVEAETPRAE